MKIGILTFHDGINHGAYLQAYSLYKVLSNKFSDNEIKIINYKNKKHLITEYKFFLIQKNPINIIKNILKIFKFRKLQDLFNLTKFTTEPDKPNKDNFDVIIYGSDEIWNFSNSLFGCDKVYFGFDLNAKCKISYAPSFSEAKIENFPSDLKEFYKNFNFISVRDSYSKKLFNQINQNHNINCIEVLDPTFLYDFRNEEKEISSTYLNNYILIYCTFLDKNDIDNIKDYAKNTKMKLISIGYKNYFADESVINLDPFEWISYFKNANYIVTNTFHGTVFSIKYNKKFISIPKNDKKNKIISLLDQFKLKDRACTDKYDLTNILKKEINYDEVNSLIDKQKRISLNFLINSIENYFPKKVEI